MQIDTKHQVTIVLNMDEFQVAKGKLTYEEIARLAFPQDNDPEIIYTITVTYRHQEPRSLARGDKPVETKEGMVIDARKTGRS